MDFGGLKVDAVHVHADGRLLGWAWGPDWMLKLPESPAAGLNSITAWVYPSTFNFYGPHRHLDGDRHLVTPDQFVGRKNFADRPDAPEDTRSANFHFKPVRLPEESFLRA